MFTQISKKEYKKSGMDFMAFANIMNNHNAMNAYLKIQSVYQYHGSEYGSCLGKPPYRDWLTENIQGVWCYKDAGDITWVYWTDAYKKNHYKGGDVGFFIEGFVFEDFYDDNKAKIILQNCKDFLKFLVIEKNYIPSEDKLRAWNRGENVNDILIEW